jgi:hypothetical protein
MDFAALVTYCGTLKESVVGETEIWAEAKQANNTTYTTTHETQRMHFVALNMSAPILVQLRHLGCRPFLSLLHDAAIGFIFTLAAEDSLMLQDPVVPAGQVIPDALSFKL